jgi:hypothetical protein
MNISTSKIKIIIFRGKESKQTKTVLDNTRLEKCTL